MRITAKKSVPSNNELIELLKKRFSKDYSYELFGLDCQKSVIVSKSPFVGAQISIHDNEVTVQGTPPSMAVGYAMLFFDLIGLGIALGTLYGSPLQKFEKDVTGFLRAELC